MGIQYCSVKLRYEKIVENLIRIRMYCTVGMRERDAVCLPRLHSHPSQNLKSKDLFTNNVKKILIVLPARIKIVTMIVVLVIDLRLVRPHMANFWSKKSPNVSPH